LARVRRAVGLALVLAILAAATGYLSAWPRYRSLAPGDAVIKLSIAHLGAREGECRQLSAEEIATLPQHKRKTEECPRGRLPVAVEVLLDGAGLFAREENPAGFSRDGASRFYERASVASGPHELTLRLRDTARTGGFDHEATESVVLLPAQVLVIGFDSESRVFTLR
jgi:hypothetical protein